MAKLLLLRHGQILANREGRWHGSTDSPLTLKGRRQVKRTARYIAGATPTLDAIYTSPLQRCRDTAQAIARRLKLQCIVEEGLREYAIGEWENMPFKLLAEEHRFFETTRDDHDFAPPGGESLKGVAARIVSTIREIHERHEGEKQILLVGHGAAMAVALGALLDENPGEWTNYPLANCSLTELMLSPAPYVNFMNSTYHL